MDAVTGSVRDGAATMIIDWGVCGRAFGGEAVSGDLHVVLPVDHGVLVAVIDGLGHGAEAAAASQAAAAALRQDPGAEVVALLQRCHEALRKTRGAVMSLAAFDVRSRVMTWIGVGNIEGILFRAAAGPQARPEYLQQRGGVVGYQLPPLRAAVVPVRADDMLILATDGVSGKFSQSLPMGTSQAIADDIIAHHAKASDDALVLVARYLGDTP